MQRLALITTTLVAILATVLYEPLTRSLTILGVFRHPAPTPAALDDTLFKRIDDTKQCEDLHYYEPAGVLFAACEDSKFPRFEWWPPMTTFRRPSYRTGSIHVIEPRTMKSTRLSFENFQGPFITHGIEVIPDPNTENGHHHHGNAKAVYIYAVNHPPNPEYYHQKPKNERGEDDNKPEPNTPKARSQIELFHHTLGTKSARHVRSIRHPLITTPNDIYAESPTSFYVSNDHYHREGMLRLFEDVFPVAKWSNVVHVWVDPHSIDHALGGSSSSSTTKDDAESNIQATIALDHLHNPNGLGHGDPKLLDNGEREMLIVSAMGGVMHRARVDESNHTVSIKESVHLASQLDNPSYFVDRYRKSSGDGDVNADDDDDDASGYIIPGLARPIDAPKTQMDPNATEGVVVWYVRRGRGGEDGWERRLLFEDDGRNIRSVSTAVLVGIDPAVEGGRKKGWLFVTGFFGDGIVAVKVSL